jgi:hypothetical protein
VLSLSTGYVSPQFHIVLDPTFTTVNGKDGTQAPPSLWQMKCGFLKAPASRFVHMDKNEADPAFVARGMTIEGWEPRATSGGEERATSGRETIDTINQECRKEELDRDFEGTAGNVEATEGDVQCPDTPSTPSAGKAVPAEAPSSTHITQSGQQDIRDTSQ